MGVGHNNNVNDGLTNVVTLAQFGVMTGFSCSAQLTTGGCCQTFPQEQNLEYYGVIGNSRFVFSECSHIGWFTIFGKDGLLDFLEWI